MKILKSFLVVVTIIVAATLIPQIAKCQTVPATIKDMTTNEDVGAYQYQLGICKDKFWDTLLQIQLDNPKEGDSAKVILSNADGDFVIAGFTYTGGKVVYSTWFSRAQVYYENDPYNHWYEGQVVDISRRVFISFAMYGDNPWNKCSSMDVVINGGLKITVVSLVTVANTMCQACAVVEPCATICMRNSWNWSNMNRDRYSVAQFAVNFGNDVAANSSVVTQNLRNGNANGQAAAFQLNIQRGQSPPQNAGRGECYTLPNGKSLNFEPVTLSSGEVVNLQTQVAEINRLLKVSIKTLNGGDFNKLIPIITAFNNLNNCPQN